MNKRAHSSPLCNLFPKNRKGMTLLLENIIFIILNLIFIAILIVFLVSKSNSASVLEEKYSKEIALMLDSARPGMIITFNVADAVSAAEKNLGKGNVKDFVTIKSNVVNVNLGTKIGYSYSFFNYINFDGKNSNYYFDKVNNNYVFFIGDYNA